MSGPPDSSVSGYDALFGAFDSPLSRQLRREAYGEDVGQHSWVRAEELRQDVARLDLSAQSRLLDLGCGPCGPLTFLLAASGCQGTGTDASAAALASGRARASSLGLEGRLTVRQADLDDPLPFPEASFDAAICLDTVLHLADRTRLFREVARVLAPAGRFLLTDAGVVTGPLSDEEIAARSAHGSTTLVSPGLNEKALEAAGFRLFEIEDRTESVVANASGRLAARSAHREELASLEGPEAFERTQRYLRTTMDLSRRRAISRIMYLSQSHGGAE